MGDNHSVTMGGNEESFEGMNMSTRQNPTSAALHEEDLLAGKYKTEEELEKGTLELLKQKGDLSEIYKQLESTGGFQLDTSQQETSESDESNQEERQQEETDEPNEQSTESEETQERAKTQVDEILEQNGLSVEQFNQELVENGTLTEESYN
jgi:hypothetical protein